jgi:copper chaperone CopZ
VDGPFTLQSIDMKKLVVIIAVLFVSQLDAQVTKATLQASGLTCAMCSKAVFKALSAVPFVEKVQPNIQLSSYDLVFKPGSKIDFDALSKAVVDAGFSVSMLKVTTRFQDTKVQDDAHVNVGDKLFHFVNVPSQTLSGEKTIKLIDRNFVGVKDQKKYEKMTSMKCYQTGMMDGQRVYHVTM